MTERAGWERRLAAEGLAPLDEYVDHDGRVRAARRLSRRGDGSAISAEQVQRREQAEAVIAERRAHRPVAFAAPPPSGRGPAPKVISPAIRRRAWEMAAGGESVKGVGRRLGLSFRLARRVLREANEGHQEEAKRCRPRTVRDILPDCDPRLLLRLAVRLATLTPSSTTRSR